MAEDLQKNDVWNKSHLDKIFASASPEISHTDIETYKSILNWSPAGNISEIVTNLDPSDHLSTECTVFGIDRRAPPPYNQLNSDSWRTHSSYLFRYPVEKVRSEYGKYQELSKDLSKMSKDFVFSGAWIPVSLVNLIPVMKSNIVQGQGLVMDIGNIHDGVYSDIPGPLKLTYRKHKNNLIGQFKDLEGRILGYKVCYRKSETLNFCYAKGGFNRENEPLGYSGQKTSYEFERFTFSPIILLFGGTDLRNLRARMLFEMKIAFGCRPYDEDWNPEADIKWAQNGTCHKENGGANTVGCRNVLAACKSLHQAVSQISCGNDLARLPIQVWQYDPFTMKGRFTKAPFYR